MAKAHQSPSLRQTSSTGKCSEQSSFLSDLKAATQSLHDELETVSYAREILSRQISLEQYVELLVKNAFCYKQIEGQIAASFPVQKVGPLSAFSSKRGKDLTQDLNDLKEKPHKFSSPTHWEFQFPNTQLASLVGALYVLEGARLGGKVLVRALRENKALNQVKRFHFFEQEGIHVGTRWRNFRELATSVIHTHTAQQTATRSAQSLFRSFYQAHS